jgi:hypothetical protein
MKVCWTSLSRILQDSRRPCELATTRNSFTARTTMLQGISPETDLKRTVRRRENQPRAAISQLGSFPLGLCVWLCHFPLDAGASALWYSYLMYLVNNACTQRNESQPPWIHHYLGFPFRNLLNASLQLECRVRARASAQPSCNICSATIHRYPGIHPMLTHNSTRGTLFMRSDFTWTSNES